MLKTTKLFGQILFFVLLTQTIVMRAQPNVSFTASVNEGCVPFEVIFTSTVEGCSGAVSYDWDFGYAGGSSSLANPTTLYNNSGTYTVTLSVSCAEGTDTYDLIIEAHEPPVAFFEEPVLEGCVPLTLNLTDGSTPGDAAITQWRWYWGDGTEAGVSSTPSHNYNFSGIFDVLLEVTDGNSCVSSFDIDNLVWVSDTPHITFVAYPMSYCQTPLEVHFQSLSQTQLNLPYQAYWIFGDGSANGTGLTTTHQYNNPGSYDVTLTVIDDYGCTNALTKEDFISINQIIPFYNIAEGDTVCKGTPVHFMNLTAYDCLWDFGDGSPTTDLNAPTHFFNNSGTFNVTLTVDPDGECINDTVFQIYVEEIEAGFTVMPNTLFSCDIPFSVSFTNESSDNATIFNYVFGDGLNSVEENPTHDYTTPGTFITSLSVTSANGCTDNIIGPTVTIVSPDATFEVDSTEGCADLDVIFTYSGTTDLNSIQSWDWDFGDATSSTDPETTMHVYSNPGEYTAILSITDDNDCTGFYEQIIYVGEPIPAEVEFQQWDELTQDWVELMPDDTLFCAQDTIRVHNLLWENEDLDDIEWLIDSISDENSTQEYLEWTMDQDTGSVHIFIVTNYNGCRDTVKLFDRFYIDGPIIDDIQQDYECSNPFDYTFTLNITEGDYWNWYFDDGSPSILNSTNESINHSFPGTGEYWLTVIAYNTETGCEYLDSLRIEIYQPEAIFYANNNNVCVNDPIIFSGDNSTDAVSYYWDFGDGEILDWSDNAFPQHAYSSSGDFVVTLTIEDSNGCQASTTQNVHVVGPGIEIIALPDTHGCNELEVDFSYIVDFDPSYNIIYKLWSLSNGVTNTQETFSYTFLPGSYDVSLTIAISNGVSTCYNTLTLPDYITVTSLETEVHTFEYNNTGCTGEVMQFYAGIEDPMLNYSWDFGDGNTSTEINPTHVFTSGGDFNVVLTLDDGLGCSNTGNVEVEIQEINADFTLAQNTFSCYPAFLDITNLVDPDEYNPSFEWVMENLTTGAIDTLPLYVPEDYYFNAPGTYQITLNVFTIHGCFGTHSETVTVNGPSAEWHIDPDTVCAGDTVHFSVFNLNNVENFTWYILGESITNQEEFDYVFEEATPTGFTEIQLSIVSGLCNPIFEIRVYVQDVFADMNVLDTTSWLPSTSGCSPFITNLLNTSIGADSINWQIGNQYIENIDSLIVSFTNSGGISDSVYVVSLFAENELGCKDTLNQEITVYASPQIQITSDTIICLGDNLGLFATGGSTYEWTPNSFIEGENTNTPIINPEDNTTYTVHVINSNNCEAYDSVYIMVQQMPEISVSPDSATIIIGDSVNVDVITNQDNMTFTWIPQEEISCFHCPLPVMSPKQDTRYQLTVTDSIGCFSYTFNVDIFVIVEYTLDVPSAFTPLGHETNRIVYARGFGIKNLIEFRIYNRWGEEVFYTDDLEQGWDGYYNGKLQNIDTYKYYVKAEMWDGTIKTIKGDILLMR